MQVQKIQNTNPNFTGLKITNLKEWTKTAPESLKTFLNSEAIQKFSNAHDVKATFKKSSYSSPDVPYPWSKISKTLTNTINLKVKELNKFFSKRTSIEIKQNVDSAISHKMDGYLAKQVKDLTSNDIEKMYNTTEPRKTKLAFSEAKKSLENINK